jgi:hypothetical protein
MSELIETLKKRGVPSFFADWNTYKYTITPADVAPLVQAATSVPPQLDAPADYLPIHAWRALAYAPTQEALPPLTALFTLLEQNDDHEMTDWWSEDLSATFKRYGMAAIEPIGAQLATLNELGAEAAAETLSLIALEDENARAAVVALFIKRLSNYRRNSIILNGIMIDYLAEVKATEADALIQQAFEARAVSTVSSDGDLEAVRVRLGTLPPSALPRTQMPSFKQMLATSARELEKADDEQEPETWQDVLGAPKPRLNDSEAKARRAKQKQAKKARKQQRKK